MNATSKRLTRKMSDVIADVKDTLRRDYNIGPKEITAFRRRADSNGFTFPIGTHLVDVNNLWIDYEVQRDVIIKHIVKIIKFYDPRLCGPASACTIKSDPRVFTYDGQHRIISTAILGYEQLPVIIVHTDDPAFPSYAFEMINKHGTKKLVPSDLHRNSLTRYRLGSREEASVDAHAIQQQFDLLGIDFEDKITRSNPSLSGLNDHFFSHFKYAYKALSLDKSGKTLYNILNAIKTVYSRQEEIDQGVFIGLYELARLSKFQELPSDWMMQVLKLVKKSFVSSTVVHKKAKHQWEHINPGATWSAPSAMANFLREIYIYNGGTIELPYHGEGSKMMIENNPATGLFSGKK